MAADDTRFFSPNPLPFTKPSAAEIAAGFATRIIRFTNAEIAQAPWDVTEVVLPQFNSPLDRRRWRFTDVVEETPGVMRANLRFVATDPALPALTAFALSVLTEDILLKMAWDGLIQRQATFQLTLNGRNVNLPVTFAA